MISGPGLANIHAFTHPDGCAACGAEAGQAAAPSDISAAALERRCPDCVRALELFVSVYGAEAGNLALRSVASAGVFIGGGIAPKILPALQDGRFIEAFRAKAPMEAFLSRVPVSVILNDRAGLLGAAVHAGQGALASSARGAPRVVLCAGPGDRASVDFCHSRDPIAAKEKPMTDPTPASAPSGNRTIMIVLSYLGLLALIPLLVEKNDKEVQWHAKHGLVLLVAEIALFIAYSILMWLVTNIPFLGCIAAPCRRPPLVRDRDRDPGHPHHVHRQGCERPAVHASVHQRVRRQVLSAGSESRAGGRPWPLSRPTCCGRPDHDRLRTT